MTTDTPQLPPVRSVIVVNVPSALPTPPDGYRLTRLATLLDDHFPDAYFTPAQLRYAASCWAGWGYQRCGLFALAVYDHPVLDLSEVYAEWSEQNAQWSGWRTRPDFGSAPAPTATEIEAHAGDLAAEQLSRQWTAEDILRREG